MSTVSPVLEHPRHDHARCAADALSHAESICTAEGLRFSYVTLERACAAARLG